jgi:putative transposase
MSKYVGTEASDAKRLRELETANAKLKRLLAESTLDQAALKDAQSRR